MGSWEDRRRLRLTAAARLLAVLAIGGPILWTRDPDAVVALAAVAGVWLLAQLVTIAPRLARFADPTLEAAAVGLICGLTLHSSVAVVASLSLAPFLGGLRSGTAGVMYATAAQLVCVVVPVVIGVESFSNVESQAVFTWSVAGVGIGLVAALIRSTLLQPHDELAPYREAQQLIRELIDVSGGLGTGLDLDRAADQVMARVADRVPVSSQTLFIARGELLVPLASRHAPGVDAAEVDSAQHDLAIEAWARGEPLASHVCFAAPLGQAAVLAGTAAPHQLTGAEVETALVEVFTELRPLTVQLDTALMFAQLRDAATADVRRRLSREMHDGVAQDVAALGYVVDALAAQPATPAQAEQLGLLRRRISSIVAEVRQSVLVLRTSAGGSESLGGAIAALARNLSETSHLPIEVTLDEEGARLRPDVEAELLRIAQEAMNNAVKHARASTIAVHCEVRAPDARITVTDDGRGLGRARNDSHGLEIMRERAGLVGAQLTIAENPTGGLVVTVVIDSALTGPPATAPTAHARGKAVTP